MTKKNFVEVEIRLSDESKREIEKTLNDLQQLQKAADRILEILGPIPENDEPMFMEVPLDEVKPANWHPGVTAEQAQEDLSRFQKFIRSIRLKMLRWYLNAPSQENEPTVPDGPLEGRPMSPPPPPKDERRSL